MNPVFVALLVLTGFSAVEGHQSDLGCQHEREGGAMSNGEFAQPGNQTIAVLGWHLLRGISAVHLHGEHLWTALDLERDGLVVRSVANGATAWSLTDSGATVFVGLSMRSRSPRCSACNGAGYGPSVDGPDPHDPLCDKCDGVGTRRGTDSLALEGWN
jgi:hypothetical protein